MKDPYKVLQVDNEACSEVISAAYRALMKLHHPDKDHSGFTAKDINEANDILSDSKKRREYDLRNMKKPSGVGKNIGPYKILGMIAEGGFGRTYKAEHTVLKELVCIKDCSNVSLSDSHFLIKEAKALWDLRHYALPAMRDLIQLDDGRIVLVMSYIPGLTIEQIVKKTGRIDFEHTAWITERILNACMYMHRHGVVHGDLKPQNVIVEAEKHMATVVDFGLSEVKPTSTSEAKGYTEYFAPPEEINGKPLIPESDYYSLGMTMIYMLAGGAEYVERKEVPSDVPDELCAFIKRLIARDVNSRPQYAKEDLVDTFVDLRKKVFGRARSGMKPLVV
jgi:serine/threonine protein kinase